MANAFESSLSVHQLPRPKRDEPRAEPEGALKERIHRKVQAGESKVTLSALQPGMRLMRPVVSTDGTLLLPENVVLDDDIIWKLWRLAAIKPLYTPVCVVEG